MKAVLWVAPIILGAFVLLLQLSSAASDKTILQGKSDESIKSLPIPDDYFPDARNVIRLTWKPRAFLYKGFLSHDECDYIVNISLPKMERSTVIGNDGESVVDNIRTSYGTFLDKYEDPVVSRIEERIGVWTFLPLENQEAMQVLRYNPGQQYRAHHDWFEVKEKSGPRYATVLMYLSDVVKGGETVFPLSEVRDPDMSLSECGRKGVAARARKGDALLFFSMNPDTTFDTASMHAGCPVIEGEKWSATKWIRVGQWDPPFRDPNLCQDEDPNCLNWARIGECERNPVYMIGGNKSHNLGFCRKSCGACRSNGVVQ